MQAGQVVEEGDGRADLLRAPASLHPRAARRADPARPATDRAPGGRRRRTMSASLLEVSVWSSATTAATARCAGSTASASRSPPGETLGLVGESGCGKTTLCRSVLRLVEPTAGSIRFNGQEIGGLSARAMRPLRREIQMVFQDPYRLAQPAQARRRERGEPLRLQGVSGGAELRRQVVELLERVGLGRRAPRPLPPPALRRTAPAGRHRPRPGACARSCRRRRAGLLARRLTVAGADPGPARRATAGDGPELPLRLPRHRRRPPRLRPDRGDVRRADRRGGARPTGLRAPLHPYTKELLAAVPIADPRESRAGAPAEGPRRT